MYSKKSDKPIVALMLSQRKAYAKGFDFKEIPSRLVLPLLLCEKKLISKERGKSLNLRKELEGKQAKVVPEISNDMYANIAKQKSLEAAFGNVKRNKGCAGIDRQSVAMFEAQLKTQTQELARLLAQKRYQPLPVKRVSIPKANRKLRPLGIPAVRDRVVQQAVLDDIQPILDPKMSPLSFGFRPGKSALQAVQTVKELLEQGYRYIVDADVADFFCTLNHQILMAKVRRNIADRDTTKLIYQFIKAGVMEEGKLRANVAGTPQGGVISPILANLYLDDLDRHIGKTDWKLVRYADDFVILCKTVNQAVQAYRVAGEILGKLKLKFAQEKTRVIDAYQTSFTFLGYTFWRNDGKTFSFPSDKAMKAYREKVAAATRRQQAANLKMVIDKLNPIIRGWGNYFKSGNCKTRFRELDGWTRMRLRSFIAKKHRLCLSAHIKYPDSYFKELGLVFLADFV